MQSPFLYAGLVIFLFGIATLAGVFWALRREAGLRQRAALSAAELAETRRELETVLQINREFAQSKDEQTLVRAALVAINRLARGLGCSYVPFDVWGEPLPAFTFGDLPEPVLKGWAAHLVSEHVRSRCAACERLHAAPGQECPLHVGPMGAGMAIYCLPLRLGERRLGMVNLYLAPGQVFEPVDRAFVESLLDQLAVGVETMRLRQQELATLDHLQRLRSPRGGLSAGLAGLLESARQALNAEGLLLQVRPMADARLSNLRVQAGILPLELDADASAGLERGIQGRGSCAASAPDGLDWAAEPVVLPDGQVLGALFALRRASDPLAAGRWAGLELVAARAALMLENERVTLGLEYSLLVQERTRLAREIHDGLAQTLAYLKMQSAQMQVALNQGDQSRLARLLQENRSALADAYHETRQVIDHLRLNPDEGLSSWVRQSARDFERTAGIKAEVALPEDELDLLPEIQAHMMRIVQEALNNVRKHAHAGQVRITLRTWEQDLILEVVDDGRGFDPEDVPVAAQYGLRGMRERAELIGAEFQIASQPSQGTTVRVFIPYQVQEAR